MKKIIVLFLIIFAVVPKSAFAYMDPGTGSLIAQVLLGGVAGVAISCKLYWKKLVSFFKRGNKEQQ